MKQSLRQRILNYHKRQAGVWIPKGEILRIVQERTNYTSENAGRRLRELAEDGYLKTKLVDGHAHYCYEPKKQTIKRYQQVIVEGRPVMRIIEV